MQTRSELLERESEVDTFDHAIAAACRRSGGVIVVEGPAGIGKTSLLTAARDLTRAAGMRVLGARGSEFEREFPYGVIRQLFEPVLARAGKTEREELLRGAVLAEGVFGTSPAVDSSTLTSESLFGLLHGLFWFAFNLAERRPLALAVDDLHWCDEASLRALAYVARRIEDLPILIVASLRPLEPGWGAARLGELTSDPIAVVVRPAELTNAAVARLVRERLCRDAAEEFCAACHEVTGGNPLLVSELIDALAAERVAPTAERARLVARIGARAVSRTVLFRLSRLPQEAAALARAVAILGDGAELRHAAGVAGVATESASTAADVLAQANILRPEPLLAFVHPVVRAAVYDALGRGEREEAHARAARVLSDQGAPVEQVAAQLLLTPSSGWLFAVRVLRHAARHALRQGAPESAVAYLGRALEEPPTPEERPDVLYELGSAERLAHGPAAVEHLSEAVAQADDASKRGRAALELGQLLFFSKRGHQAFDILEGAISELPDHERDLRARLESVLLHFAAYEPSLYPRARERLAQLRVRPRDESLGERTLQAILAFHDARAGAAKVRCLERAERSLGGTQPNIDETVLLLGFVGFVFTLADRFAIVRELFDQAILDAQARGSVLAFAAISCLRANAAFRGGALADAEADARHALEASESHGIEHTRPYATAYLVDVLLERGDVRGAAAALSRVELGDPVSDTAHLHFFRHSRARTWMLHGQMRQGLDELLELGRSFEAVGGSNPAVLPWRSDAALAHRALGNSSEARRLAGEEVKHARAWGAPRALGKALRAAGLIEEGRAGLDMLREALEWLEASEAYLDRARASTDLGAALRRANRRQEARELLREGLELAHGCGADALEEQARGELLAAGARPRRLATTGVESLTASERRISKMAATGMTNRDIAQALFVTPKTVEMHLHNAFRKLGIRSRTQLAPVLQEPVAARPSEVSVS